MDSLKNINFDQEFEKSMSLINKNITETIDNLNSNLMKINNDISDLVQLKQNKLDLRIDFTQFSISKSVIKFEGYGNLFKSFTISSQNNCVIKIENLKGKISLEGFDLFQFKRIGNPIEFEGEIENYPIIQPLIEDGKFIIFERPKNKKVFYLDINVENMTIKNYKTILMDVDNLWNCLELVGYKIMVFSIHPKTYDIQVLDFEKGIKKSIMNTPQSSSFYLLNSNMFLANSMVHLDYLKFLILVSRDVKKNLKVWGVLLN